MTEKVLSELQKEYRTFFLDKLAEFGVKSPANLSKEKKSEFFTSIKQDWAKIKLSKIVINEPKIKEPEIEIEIESEIEKSITEKKEFKEKRTSNTKCYKTQKEESLKVTEFDGNSKTPNYTKQVIKSKPNEEQKDDLKILYTPNFSFEQATNYCYPVVKMPKINSYLKLARIGRTNQKGYKEKDFYNELKLHFTDLELTNNVHMIIPNYNKPYEPDIVLFDKKRNLYIDIEIDEPYDGYYRYPTHCIKLGKLEEEQNVFKEEIKQDDIRDLFFTESGWIVIRFTEKQVHLQSNECIDFVRNVVNSICNFNYSTTPNCNIENQWNENQCIQWQKINYREKYLGIDKFRKQYNFKEIEIDIKDNESIENIINRTKKYNFNAVDSEIAFDKETHKYINSKDETGNAEFISVTTLIERFFPFDLKRYIEKKAKDENITEEEVLIEYLMIRDEAAEKGTYLHNQIENFLKGKTFDSELTEFEYFLNFYNSEIKNRNLKFYKAEKKIYSKKYNIAGTIDCLFKKIDKEEFVMLDWKRSKKLTIDGHPLKFGFGFALSELKHLDNSSFYRYSLQQNIYKYIVEKENKIKISSMRLVVLHENNNDYEIVKVPEMQKEVEIIFKSLNHKI